MKRAVLIISMVVLIFISGCVFQLNKIPTDPSQKGDNPNLPVDPGKTDTPDVPDNPDKPDIPDEPVNKNKVIKIVAAGDNLLHNTISFDAARENGTYDFSPIYTNISSITKSAQISFINQEIMLTGSVSGYPRMQAPAEVADALIDAGFNVINLATNHTLDKGEDGLAKCIANVKARNFEAMLGVFEKKEDVDEPILIEKGGIVFGFLSYTYDMNGYTLSKGNEWKIAVIDEARMVREMKKLRPLCDYLIVSMHWGVEYQTEPSKYQRKLGQLLCDYGADLIIGTHPHVLQPLETLTSTNGKRQTICAWSLGNFISNQHKPDTMLGGMLQVELVYNEDKELIEKRASIIPTVTDYDDNAKNYKVFLLKDYTEEQASLHGIRKYADAPLSLEYLNNLAEKILAGAIADEIY